MATQLIPGRWYDFRQEEYNNKVAGRYLSTTNGYFYMDQGIFCNTGWYKVGQGSWYMPKEIKEFPLEELKKWLPEEEYKKYVGEPDYEIY